MCGRMCTWPGRIAGHQNMRTLDAPVDVAWVFALKAGSALFPNTPQDGTTIGVPSSIRIWAHMMGMKLTVSMS